MLRCSDMNNITFIICKKDVLNERFRDFMNYEFTLSANKNICDLIYKNIIDNKMFLHWKDKYLIKNTYNALVLNNGLFKVYYNKKKYYCITCEHHFYSEIDICPSCINKIQ